MKKDHTRDYATEMFRLYAAAGMPTYEAERTRIYNDALRRCSQTDAARAVAFAEREVEKAAPYLCDIIAVAATFDLLERGGKHDIVRAVKAVYCAYPTMPLRRDTISRRVRRFASSCPADERTVYRWLREARLLCAAARGLRIPEEE